MAREGPAGQVSVLGLVTGHPGRQKTSGSRAEHAPVAQALFCSLSDTNQGLHLTHRGVRFSQVELSFLGAIPALKALENPRTSSVSETRWPIRDVPA